MELGKLGDKITQERNEQLRAKEAERAEMLARQESKNDFESKIEHLMQPNQLVKSLLLERGIDWSEGALPWGGEVNVAERFRLRPAQLNDQPDIENQFHLLITGNVSGNDLKPQPMRLSLLVSGPDETQLTEHYLTHISNPVRLRNGLPEDYGLRTYVYGKHRYQVSSHVPNETDTKIIVGLIREAAELQGITNTSTEATA